MAEENRPTVFPPPGAPTPDRGLIEEALAYAVGSAKHGATQLGAGMLAGTSTSFHIASNAVGVLDTAARYIGHKTGIENRGGLFEAIEDYLAEKAEINAAAFESIAGTSLNDQLWQVIGGLPYGIVNAAAAIAALGGPVRGLAALEALGVADEGLGRMLERGAVGAATGAAFRISATASRPARASLLAATGAATAEGGLRERLVGGVSLGALGYMTPTGRVLPIATRGPTGRFRVEADETRPTPKPKAKPEKDLSEAAIRERIENDPAYLSKLRAEGDEAVAALDAAVARRRAAVDRATGKAPPKETAAEEAALQEVVQKIRARGVRDVIEEAGTAAEEEDEAAAGAAVDEGPVVTEAEALETLLEENPELVGNLEEYLGRAEDLVNVTVNDKAYTLNLRRLDSPERLKQSLTEIVDILRPQIDQARRGTIPLAETEAKALEQETGVSLEKLLRRKPGEAFNAEDLTAARVVNASVHAKWSEMIQRELAGGTSEAERAELIRMTGLMGEILPATLGVSAEAGRALSAHRILAGPRPGQMRAAQELIDSFQGKSGMSVTEFAQKAAELTDKGQQARFARKAMQPTLADKLVEIWINGLLSGPQTHAVNMLSNEATSIWSVPEAYWAATLGAGRMAAARATGRTPPADRVYFREGTARLYGWARGHGEGLRLAARALRTGEPTDPGTKIEHQQHRAVGGRAGEFIRTPGRFLLAEDELYKHVGYLQEMYARSVHQALSEGHRGAAAGARVAELRRAPPDSMIEAAKKAGRKQTFTEPLGERGRGLQTFLNHPMGRLVVPFVRTPTNIFKYTAERTPFGFAMKEVQGEIEAGGARRDAALSKITLASGVMAWVATQAAAGKITGAGPSDPVLRRQWRETGKAPYSVLVGDTWVSYQRTEPLGTLIGFAADWSEISGHVKQHGAEKLAAQIALAASKNITSKTFLSGMSNLAQALADPDRYGSNFINRFAGSAVPTGVAQLNRAYSDPVLRDTRSALDAVRSRVPGLSDGLPAVRNLWGEAIELSGGWGPDIISPFYQSKVNPDKATNEAWRLQARLTKPRREIYGIELTGHEYAEYQEILGQRAKRKIDAYVNLPSYDTKEDSRKREKIEDRWNDARKYARRQMRRKYPERFGRTARKEAERLEEERGARVTEALSQ